MSKFIDPARESKAGRAILAAHVEFLELAGIAVTRHPVPAATRDVPGIGRLTTAPSEIVVPVLTARVRCAARHVVGYVARTTKSAEAVLYLKSESVADVQAHAARTFPRSHAPDWDPRGSIGYAAAVAVTRYLHPAHEHTPQVVWCPRCGNQDVDLEEVRRQRAASVVDIKLRR